MSDTKTCKVIILLLGKLTKELYLVEVAQPVKKMRDFLSFSCCLFVFLQSISVIIELSLKGVDCSAAFQQQILKRMSLAPFLQHLSIEGMDYRQLPMTSKKKRKILFKELMVLQTSLHSNN